MGREEAGVIERRVKRELGWEGWVEEMEFERRWREQFGMGRRRVFTLREWQAVKGVMGGVEGREREGGKVGGKEKRFWRRSRGYLAIGEKS